MKITSVKTAATSGHCMHLWVRIETDAGITGLGECVHGGHQAIAIIQRELAHKLIGRDPFAIDAIFEELRRSLVFEGGFAGALITALTGSLISLDLIFALYGLAGFLINVNSTYTVSGGFVDSMKRRSVGSCRTGVQGNRTAEFADLKVAFPLCSWFRHQSLLSLSIHQRQIQIVESRLPRPGCSVRRTDCRFAPYS